MTDSRPLYAGHVTAAEVAGLRAERDAALAEAARLREALTKINVGEGGG